MKSPDPRPRRALVIRAWILLSTQKFISILAPSKPIVQPSRILARRHLDDARVAARRPPPPSSRAACATISPSTAPSSPPPPPPRDSAALSRPPPVPPRTPRTAPRAIARISPAVPRTSRSDRRSDPVPPRTHRHPARSTPTPPPPRRARRPHRRSRLRVVPARRPRRSKHSRRLVLARVARRPRRPPSSLAPPSVAIHDALIDRPRVAPRLGRAPSRRVVAVDPRVASRARLCRRRDRSNRARARAYSIAHCFRVRVYFSARGPSRRIACIVNAISRARSPR